MTGGGGAGLALADLGTELKHPRQQRGVRTVIFTPPEAGTCPVQYVVPAGPAHPARAQQEESELAEALRRACVAELPKPERPAAFHLVAELPLGATGKVSAAASASWTQTAVSRAPQHKDGSGRGPQVPGRPSGSLPGWSAGFESSHRQGLPARVPLRVNRMRDIGELAERLRDFAAARDWEQFHTPKNLAMALAGEAGELLAEFQWLTPEEAAGIMADPQAARQVRSEIADVFLYLTRLADVLGVDLLGSAADKLEENERRYDAATYRGSRRKAPALAEKNPLRER